MGSHATPAAHHADQHPGDVAHLHTHGFTPVPWLVQWMATTSCELRCPHCMTAGPPSDDMPLDQALDLVDQVAEMGVPELLVTGGEPLLRPDLPSFIHRMAERNQRWSLNTAIMPSTTVRDAITAHPPSFVAVSLDGPREVHDGFRGRVGCHDEALEAMRWFAALPHTRVAAGTTVTTNNIASLSATLQEVMSSGADSWGLHLCVDEGEARGRPDLIPDRQQLAWLLRFTARTKRWFPVSMADEMGYCGEWEPLVRDLPLRCGAGRMQCVVLPDGSVVPCTTTDRSTRAGTLEERSLAEIWTQGFADMRSWQPRGRCARCDYAPACQGGCWLQRRRGNACFRDVWHVPGALRTAAGLAICLGGLAAAAPVQAQTEFLLEPPGQENTQRVPDSIDRAVLAAVTSGYAENPRTAHVELPSPDGTASPIALTFVQDWSQGELPSTLSALGTRIHDALEASSPSLHLAALCWRALTQAALAEGDPLGRSKTERAALRLTRISIGDAARRWRVQIVAENLDPYLARGRTHARYAFEGSKAYIPAPTWLAMQRDTSEERWGTAHGDAREPLEGWLDRHAYAEQLQLTLSIPADAGLTMVGPAGTREVQGTTVMGIFDTLVVPKAKGGLALGLGTSDEVVITLPGRIELGWSDILQLAWLQHPDTLRERTEAHLAAYATRGDTRGQPDPVCLLPVMEQALHTEDDRRSAQARYWLADFWMI